MVDHLLDFHKNIFSYCDPASLVQSACGSEGLTAKDILIICVAWLLSLSHHIFYFLFSSIHNTRYLTTLSI